MSFLDDILGPLFLLAVGLATVVGAWSAFTKAKRVYGDEPRESLQEQHNAAVAKAVVVAVFAGIIWSDSLNLDMAVVRVAVPLGVYKFTQLVLTPLVGWHLENVRSSTAEGQIDNG